VAGQIKQPVDFLNSDTLGAVGNLHNLVSRADLSFLNHTAIEARSFVRDQERWHRGVVHSYTDAITGDAWLRHFKQCTADTVPISNADLVIGKTIDCQVLAELAILEVVTLEMRLPVAVGAELIDHHSTVFSAVACEIALTITVKIEPPRHHPACYGSLPDSGVDHFALPFDIGWKADVH
jgi:hypothetical protein